MPKRPASQPVSTHAIWVWLADRLPSMCGSATLAIVVSIPCMIRGSMIENAIAPRPGAGSVLIPAASCRPGRRPCKVDRGVPSARASLPCAPRAGDHHRHNRAPDSIRRLRGWVASSRPQERYPSPDVARKSRFPVLSAGLRGIDPHRDGGTGDDRAVMPLIVGNVETALDDRNRDPAVRQRRRDRRAVDLLRALHADRDRDLHPLRLKAERAQEGQRAVTDRILDRAHRRFRVVAAVQIGAAAQLEDHAGCRHYRLLQGISSRTTAAAWASTVASVPASFGISSPPLTTRTVPVPCGRTASTAARSTRSGSGTPIVTATCIASADRPSALAIESALRHNASRSARTAAFV